MWSVNTEPLNQYRGIKLKLEKQGRVLSFGQVLDLWVTAPDFCRFFNQRLAHVSYSAFRWETPCLTATDRPFECAVLDAPSLDRPADPSAFVEHLEKTPTDQVIRFANLRGDAEMIVPRAETDHDAYTHLARFVRQAPASQQEALWRLVGQTMKERRSPAPLWLSTAGAGVAWLHVRIDQRPKYYGYAPYRQTY